MKTIMVNGGIPLFGNLRVQGSKNAALPILFATLITDGVTTLHNIPDIGDVSVAVRLLRHFGAEVDIQGNSFTVDTRRLHYCDPPTDLLSSIRASTYLIGATLARFGSSFLGGFGGCGFAYRPIDLHIYAAEALGAEHIEDHLYASRLRGANILFPKQSVGATVNSLIMASAAEGRTAVFNYAREPHVLAVCDFLRGAGADLTLTEGALFVRGGRLHGSEYTIPGDMIEAGSYLAASLATFGEVRVSGFDECQLSSFFHALREIASVRRYPDGISLIPRSTHGFISVECAPYPDFPTDLQPLVAPLMALYGGGIIYDGIFPTRFGYLRELSSFGVISDPRTARARIYPSLLHSATATAIDLRGGMSALVCALAAKGQSRVLGADTILRGYTDPAARLSSLGADVRVVDS